MKTEGRYGQAPSWYQLVRAARYLGVPPWELYERPARWRDLALEAERAESEAVEAAMRRAQRKG